MHLPHNGAAPNMKPALTENTYIWASRFDARALRTRHRWKPSLGHTAGRLCETKVSA